MIRRSLEEARPLWQQTSGSASSEQRISRQCGSAECGSVQKRISPWGRELRAWWGRATLLVALCLASLSVSLPALAEATAASPSGAAPVSPAPKAAEGVRAQATPDTAAARARAAEPPAAAATPAARPQNAAPAREGVSELAPELPARDAVLLPRDSVDAGNVTQVPAPPEGFNTYDGGWLRLAFPPSKRHRVQPLIVDADAFREELRELFGYPVLEHVSVHVGRTPGEMATLAPPGSPFPKYAEGVAYPGLGLILLTIDPKYPTTQHDLGEVFRHELAHVALHEALEGHHVPRWLDEGFAIHLSGESSLDRMQTLATATLAETLLPLGRIDQHFPDDIVQTPIAYAQSADVVRYLLRTRYNQRFVAMLRRVRSGQPFASAMSDAYGFEVYGVGENSLEDEWRRDVAKRYSFWPVLLSGSMVWVGALGLFVVGYYRRRKQQRVTLDRWAVEEAVERQHVATQAPTGRMHIVLAPKEGSSSASPSEAVVPEFKKPTRDLDVPKVEHEGSWHTLH